MNSAGPYTVLLGQDLYNNARGNARPAGIARNTRSGAAFASLDLRVSRDFKFGSARDARVLTLAADGFNVLNRVNYGSYVGTIGSPLFGQPVTARPARQFQISLRLRL
jgi:hypothetical protein